MKHYGGINTVYFCQISLLPTINAIAAVKESMFKVILVCQYFMEDWLDGSQF
jgi:hypothetical protein